MADVTLDPTEVETFTGRTVTQAEIDQASEQIDYETGYTPTEHRDTRQIPEQSVKMAWSLVSVCVSGWLSNAGAPQPQSESQGDYSYTLPSTAGGGVVTERACVEGHARRLFQLPMGNWFHV